MTECLSPRREAVAYLRVSGLGQCSGDGFDRQAAAIAAYAQEHGLTIEHEYREEGVSGTTDEGARPAFKSLVADLLGNGCRTLVIERMDRLARSYAIQEQLLTYLAAKGIAVISADTGENVTEAMMGDPMKRAIVQMQGVFAELEKNMLVAKLRKSRDRKRAAGQKCEGRHSFPHGEAEEGVFGMMVGLVAQDYNPTRIAAYLNAQGITSRSGGKWHSAVVARILNRK